MAANVIKAGHSLWGFDVSPQAMARMEKLGGKRCSSAREASEGRDAVLISLTTPAVVEQVVLGPEGILSAVAVPAMIIDLSSGLPSVSVRLAAAARERGSDLVDAPVSGGPDGAEKGTLTVMVGGAKETYDRALPLLQSIGKNIFHIGDVGSGNAMKMVNQILCGVHMVAATEALILGAKAGIDARTMYDVIMVSSGYSRTFQNRVAQLMTGNTDPVFTVDLMLKDLNLATEYAHEMGVPMLVLNITKQIYHAAKASGLGSKDFSTVATLLEGLVGVEIRE